jgi:hypothetical protein
MLQAQTDIVAIGLETLTECLRPYVAREMESVHGNKWQQMAGNSFRSSRDNLSSNIDEWDAHALLTVMWDNWNSVFRRKLGLFERSLVAELRAFRNRWAHQRPFEFDDTYRLLDSVQRLLSRTTPEATSEISEMKVSLLRDEFGEAINRKATEDDNRIQRWAVAFVYLACGGVFVYLIPRTFPGAGGLQYLLAACVGMAMSYLIFNRFRDRPVVVGPRECRRCRRIIYGTSCPYCAPSTSTFDSNEFRLGEPESEGRAQSKAGTPTSQDLEDGSSHPGFTRPARRGNAPTMHRDN